MDTLTEAAMVNGIAQKLFGYINEKGPIDGGVYNTRDDEVWDALEGYIEYPVSLTEAEEEWLDELANFNEIEEALGSLMDANPRGLSPGRGGQDSCNRTLHIHETAIADAAFKIACDLANKHFGGPIEVAEFDAVEATIRHCLMHQLHLQSTWCTEDEELGSRQLWARPVHPVPPVV